MVFISFPYGYIISPRTMRKPKIHLDLQTRNLVKFDFLPLDSMETPSSVEHDDETDEEPENTQNFHEVEKGKLVSGDELRHLFSVMVSIDNLPSLGSGGESSVN